MTILHDSTWQFIINICITVLLCIITSSVSVWLATRKPSLPIGYETVDISSVSGDDNIRAIKKKMHIPLNKKTPDLLCLLTLKIWNAGKDPIQLPNPTPLIIKFGKEAKILGSDGLECVPDYVEVTPSIDNNELKLHIPLLMPKQYITINVLLNENVMYFPNIYSKVPIRHSITKANNIRRSKEYRNIGIISLLLFVIYMVGFLPDQTSFNSSNMQTIVFAGFIYLFFGIMLLVLSYLERRKLPRHLPLPSEIIKREFVDFLSATPFLTLVGVIAFIIYHIFGQRVLVKCIATLVFLIFPSILWFCMYYLLEYFLKLIKVNNPKVVSSILASIFPTIVFLFLLQIIIYAWTQY